MVYLAWLLAVQASEVGSGESEPPLPRGLGCLPAPLLGAFHRAYPPVVAGQRRTVGELLARAEELEAERRRAAEDRAAQARAAAAAARDKRLATLARRGAEPWQDPDQLVDARSYEQAVRLALDLHEVAVRAGELAEFGRRLADLKQRHARKRGFLDRVRRADPTLLGGAARR